MTSSNYCPQCGTATQTGAQFCGACGHKLQGEMGKQSTSTNNSGDAIFDTANEWHDAILSGNENVAINLTSIPFQFNETTLDSFNDVRYEYLGALRGMLDDPDGNASFQFADPLSITRLLDMWKIGTDDATMTQLGVRQQDMVVPLVAGEGGNGQALIVVRPDGNHHSVVRLWAV